MSSMRGNQDNAMARLLNLLPWKRRRMEQELDRELRYYMERRIEALRAAGLSEEEARRRAALEFGGVTQMKEETRDTWTWGPLLHFIRDLSYASRTLRRTPGFTAT